MRSNDYKYVYSSKKVYKVPLSLYCGVHGNQLLSFPVMSYLIGRHFIPFQVAIPVCLIIHLTCINLLILAKKKSLQNLSYFAN